MRRLINTHGTLPLRPARQSPFQSLARSIVYQQLSGKAAETILRRFIALFPGEFPEPRAVLKAADEKLRSAGLSRQKIGYLRDLSGRVAAGALPTLAECERLCDEILLEKFTEVKGIGRWTVEMFLIFNLGRPDVLPAHDLGVRKGFQTAYAKRSLPDPKRLDAFGRRWAPHRTLAARYLWRATDA